MASSPIVSWQIEGEQVEAVTDLFSWAPKSLWMFTTAIKLKDCLFLGMRAMFTNLGSILKNRNITLPIKVHRVKAIVFAVIMYGCESWITEKPECQIIDAFKLWCWRRLLGITWTARRTNQSILKEINPEYSLKGLKRSSITLAT